MTLDRGRVTLIVAAVLTVLAWGYKLWPSRPAPGRPTGPVAVAAAQPTVAPVAAPAPPLSAAALNAWVGLHRSARDRSARDPFFTVAEIDAMNRPVIVSRPTAPVAAVEPPPPLPAYTVKLIMTAGSERVASIDDRVVHVGDMMGSERVAQILPDAVVLERGGERRRLPLSGDESARGLIHIERVR